VDEVLALFLSLPPDAQAYLRTAASHRKSDNLLKLVRAVYPFVQTIAEATEIAEFLASEVTGDQAPLERNDAHSAISIGVRALVT
jgi:hypothetical protein